MTFAVQDDQATVRPATAYIDVAYFKAYHADRGNDLPAGSGNTDIQRAIVRATDYMDSRFVFVGERFTRAQRTQWPRVDAFDRNGDFVTGVPFEVKEACADYALLALQQELNPNYENSTVSGAILSKLEKLGPLEEQTEYQSGSSGGAVQTLPKYPKADLKLRAAGLVKGGGSRFKRA